MNDNLNNNGFNIPPPFYRTRPHVVHEGRYFLLDDDGNIIPEEDDYVHHKNMTRAETQKYRHHE